MKREDGRDDPETSEMRETEAASEAPTGATPPDGSTAGAIGPYRLLQKLGEGGMGEVWLAEQSQPVRRKVALKVIKRGMDSKQIVARFEAERQALAMMDHPAVARVFDAGTTERGRPYFVMEYVKGSPITEHCDRGTLTTRERIELFREVCEGVQHAHQKAIIHRDLKPSNVLVTEVGGKRVPKIIDFGIAKATAQRLTEKTMFTELGALLGTPEYMSPEQADLTGEDVDTRTDVYSLGVILYELLVGALPFDSKELRSGGFEGIRKKIREEEPRRPSTRLSTLGDRATDSATARRVELPVLRRELRGDLDWITMRALEKDRARRYASPSDLARDLERYLADEPVLATPPSAAYVAGKFVRRHRAAVVTVSLLVLALLVGAAGTTIGLLRARAAEREALKQSRDSERVSDFLASILRNIDPLEIGTHLRADLAQRMEVAGSLDRINVLDASQRLIDREIFAKASEMIERDLQEDPELAARLHFTVGQAYVRGLLLYPEAVESLRRAVDLAQRSVGDGPFTWSAREELALALRRAGGRENLEESLHLSEAVLASLLRELEETDPWVLSVRMTIGDLHRYLGDLGTAETMLRDVIPLLRQHAPPDDPVLAYALNDLALVLEQDPERREESEVLFREAIETITQLVGPDHFETLNMRQNLGVLLLRMERHDELESYARDLLDVERRSLGIENDLTVQTLGLLATVLRRLERYEEAIPVHREVIRARRLVHGLDGRVATYTTNLGYILAMAGREAEADRVFADFDREASASSDPSLDRSHSIVLYNLACGRALDGDRREGLGYLRRAAEKGFRNYEHVSNDPDVTNLRGPEFDEILERIRRNEEMSR